MLVHLCPAMFEAALQECDAAGGEEGMVRGRHAIVCARSDQGLALPRYRKLHYGGVTFRPQNTSQQGSMISRFATTRTIHL